MAVKMAAAVKCGSCKFSFFIFSFYYVSCMGQDLFMCY